MSRVFFAVQIDYHELCEITGMHISEMQIRSPDSYTILYIIR
jgi:hypothetical protein